MSHTDLLRAKVVYQGRVYNYKSPKEVICACHLAEVIPALWSVNKQVEQGSYAVGWVSYEASPAFDSAFQVHSKNLFNLPLVWFYIFDEPEVDVFTTAQLNLSFPVTRWEIALSKEEYIHAIQCIHRHIDQGNVYQVNYTFPFQTYLEDLPEDFFYHLCFAQGDGYFVYIQTDQWIVLSISPELFFHFRNGKITLKPMKGTQSRGRWFHEDMNNEAQLHQSEKDKAENLMIVDLIRNDLGKVAKIGTVTAPHLFEIDPYRTVWQMTSTISGETEKGLVEVLSVLFPRGSVTGAPKIYAMKMINEHERYPRGICCGTLGWITSHNEAVFNVAIRTLVYNCATRETVFTM